MGRRSAHARRRACRHECCDPSVPVLTEHLTIPVRGGEVERRACAEVARRALAAAGDRARSGVRWTITPAWDAIAEGGPTRGEGRDDDPHWRRIRTYLLLNPAGALVSAHVDVADDVTLRDPAAPETDEAPA